MLILCINDGALCFSVFSYSSNLKEPSFIHLLAVFCSDTAKNISNSFSYTESFSFLYCNCSMVSNNQ